MTFSGTDLETAVGVAPSGLKIYAPDAWNKHIHEKNQTCESNEI
jgi:hypothetical protein